MSRSIRRPVVLAESSVGRRVGSLPFSTTRILTHPNPIPHQPGKPPAPEVRIRRYWPQVDLTDPSFGHVEAPPRA